MHLPKRRMFVNITPQLEAALAESGIREGLALCNAMHITASVFINDDESGLHRDFEAFLEKLAPEKPYSQYHHNGFEDNADAHLKRQIMGREVVVAVTDGLLRRIRRHAGQTHPDQDHRRMTGGRFYGRGRPGD